MTANERFLITMAALICIGLGCLLVILDALT